MPFTVKHLLSVLGAVIVLAGGANAQDTNSLDSLRTGLAIDKGKISVSGLSSGGYMANQFHIAHSEKIMGAGILAGGPYHCAGGRDTWCKMNFMPHDSCQAVVYCSMTGREAFLPFLGPPGGQHAIDSTLAEAAAGRIDAIANLKGDRVWLFSGTNDETIPPGVMNVLDGYYTVLFARAEIANPPTDLSYETGKEVPHAMIVDAPGGMSAQDCKTEDSGPPFMLDCDYDAAGELLTFIYRLDQNTAPAAIKPDHGDWEKGALKEFDQRPFFDTADESISMHDVGHVYVPAACRQAGAGCPLHVAFHGCRQHREAVEGKCTGDQPCLFYEDAGYNEWAEKHGIVVLYPQATSWGWSLNGYKNPRGCWDWWGYSGDDYFRKAGKQMQAVDRMIDCLTGARPCP